MAIIKNPTDQENPINYVATLAFFCCVSCAVTMLKFRGFRASLNLTSWRKKDAEDAPAVSMTGAYRVNRDEFYGGGKTYDPPKKLTPSMVKLPPSFDPEPALRPTKSSSDLLTQAKLPAHVQLHRSTHDISADPRGAPSANGRASAPPAPPAPPERKRTDAKKNQEKEHKKLEKQKLAERKARDKAAALEHMRQEKLAREREKQAALQAKAAKRNKKASAPPTAANPLARSPAPPPPPPQPSYATNTLDSSISRSSGPPPYSEASNTSVPDVQSGNSHPSNVSFGKPIDNTTDSWDLISQHRQQMNRPVTSSYPKSRQKNMVMDLQYKLGPSDDKDNSEA